MENQIDLSMRLIGHFEGMEIWMKELRFPSPLSNDTEEEETLARPSVTSRHRAGEEFWIWDRLSDFRDAWKCVEYTLSDVESSFNIGTLLSMGCEDVLFDLKQVKRHDRSVHCPRGVVRFRQHWICWKWETLWRHYRICHL